MADRYTLRGILLFLFVNNVAGQAGDSCSTKAGKPGTCIIINNCPAAIEDIKKRVNPTICGFQGTDPIVCCAISQSTTTSRPVLTTSTQRTPTTTQYVPPEYVYEDATGDQCEALSANITAPKTGRKAWDKCVEYQEKYVYPCIKGVALTGGKTRVDHCGHGADELIVGGVDTTPREFPHMVLLGFGDSLESAQYLCGGSLISEWYILTAGHCTSTREQGDVSYARLGAHKRTDPLDRTRVYRIQTITKHPEYKPPNKYNDIALLRTERQMLLDRYAVPACLHIGDQVKEDLALATGWGAVQYKGDNADTLQKVTLQKFSTSECQKSFPPKRHFEQGFIDRTQVCYGSRTQSKDTCQGDSGGPLQIKNQRIHCMYTLVGVTSFGRACGFVGEPGIYTRVSAYTEWIESVVWA